MQLRVARVCLDCEEVHDQQQCPVCASEAFAYLTRWVPAPERRLKPRDPDQPDATEESRPRRVPPAAAPPSGKGTKVAVGVVGVAAAVFAGMWYRGRRRLEDAAERGAGELK